MGTKEHYQSKLEALESIESGKVIKPQHIPLGVYIQEAETLYHWSQSDKESLTAKGLPWELVEDLPVRCGALKEAQALWSVHRETGKEEAAKWAQESPYAYKLKSRLLENFRYAFRKKTELVSRLKNITKKKGHAGMIQDLVELSVLGKEKSELLTKIGFDLSLLDEAEKISKKMRDHLSAVEVETGAYSEALEIRNRAYTHLKEAVDEIRACGQFAFRGNKERLKGYRSEYLRRKNSKQYAKKKSAAKTVAMEENEPSKNQPV